MHLGLAIGPLRRAEDDADARLKPHPLIRALPAFTEALQMLSLLHQSLTGTGGLGSMRAGSDNRC